MADKQTEFKSGLELPDYSDLLTEAQAEALEILGPKPKPKQKSPLESIITLDFKGDKKAIAQYRESFDQLTQAIMAQNINQFQRELFQGATLNTMTLAKALAIAL